MTTRQISGYFRDGGNGRCAVGAALDAVDHCTGDINNTWLTRMLWDFGCPARMAIGITRLNDWYKWPREKIADWVERVENLRERKMNYQKEKELCHC